MNLNSLGQPRKLGIWSYGAVQADEDSILNSLTYFNMHTQLNGGGEIRGQIFFAQLPVTLCASDLDDGSGAGRPDGGVDINDLLYFLTRFEAGC